MSSPWNPPSSAEQSNLTAPGSDGDGPWRSGDHVVAIREGGPEWPPHCPVCDKPSSGEPLAMPLQWQPRWTFIFLIIGGPLLFLIAMLATRWSGKQRVHLCEEHKRRRTIGNVVVVVAVVLLLGGLFLGAAVESIGLIIVGVCGFLPLIPALFLIRTIVPVGADQRTMRFSGACPEFLDRLPPV